ncbi:DUF6896 domain-containing protein [Psychroserpens luteolus]|uniref:DUF6896 domain-containing protein n=1 Tax=Psychroserpens luteolus TaxID=2855840 RepID=UPI001E2E49FE|nr:hypothetical protein [Psychroserpens luteolus]MCD2261037.1 hypothetical protein [Psychroserpens luteolus]
MKNILYQYILIIKKFKERLCVKYNLDNNISWEKIRSIVDDMSSLDGITYKFHGAGCRLEIDNQICEFDFAPMNEYPIKFSLWKIIEFINTNTKFSELDFNDDIILNKINELIDEEILSKLKIGDFELDIYQINPQYYNYPLQFLEESD